MENEKVEIYFKNWYLILLFLCGIIFIITGILIIISPFFNEKIFSQEQYQLIFSASFSRFMYNPVAKIIIGITGILFFGFATKIIFLKIVGKKPGLITNSTGIVDNTTGISAKHIQWKNIIGIKSFNIIIVKFIAIIIDNPNEYIECIKNIILRKMAKIDYKIMGSPINIYTSVLKYKHKKLVKILEEEMKQYKCFT